LSFICLAIVSLLPTYNPLTRCHDLILPDEDLTFAICLQRALNKQHPFHLYTSPSYCSINYPPYGHLVDLFSLSSSTIDLLFQSLTNLLNSKNSHIDLPEPNFLWISSSKISSSYYSLNKILDSTQNFSTNHFSCPSQCQSKNQSKQFLILKIRCQFNNNNSKPCVTTKHTHWDRAPFICLTNQTVKQIATTSIRIPPSYSSNIFLYFDFYIKYFLLKMIQSFFMIQLHVSLFVHVHMNIHFVSAVNHVQNLKPAHFVQLNLMHIVSVKTKNLVRIY
jgi:hypothetical protein